MQEVSVIIPNYNGKAYLETCLDALRAQTLGELPVLLVDNGSTDGSLELVRDRYPWVRLVSLPENYGFCKAVNEGILLAKTPYVILLNNDTQVLPDFAAQLLTGIKAHPRAFSCAAQMIQFHDHSRLDGAGDFYNALGWAFARGQGRSPSRYPREGLIFAACAGAAIYRTQYLRQTGLLDEAHFAYLEDLDLGYRARIAGYENWYLPQAKVYHVGSGTSLSRYNAFKISHSSRNNVYLIWKNMPLLQWILNLPLLLPGFGIKLLFFAARGYGKLYAQGLKQGFRMTRRPENRSKKVRFRWENLGHYCRIQLELWVNIFRRVL